MHEWALAEAVLDSISEHAGEGKVLKVRVRFGELQRVDPEIFRTGLEALGSRYPFDPSVVQIEVEGAEFRCNRCRHLWKLAGMSDLDEVEQEAIHFLPEASHVYLRCPECGSADFEIVAGRGVSIAEIEVETGAEGPR
jgi:hydrogenase nickel incorporation protein HypA/HybF